MESRQYEVVRWIPALGLVCIAFGMYIVLYSTGVTDYKLFSKVETFDHSDPAFWGLIAFFLAAGVFLVGWGCAKIVITDDGIHYRGIVRSLHIRWCEVLCVRPCGMRLSVYLRSNSTSIEIPPMFSRQQELSDTIFERVQSHAPNAEIRRN